MLRRSLVLAFAATALLQTGCHGRVCAFFYRLTHCSDCCPSYGYGGGYGGAVYGGSVAQPCCASPTAPVYNAAPVSYGVAPNHAAPVFSGVPQAMPGPSVIPSTSMPEKK
jgi:hypothetical protein